jgi:hypothetical protein
MDKKAMMMGGAGGSMKILGIVFALLLIVVGIIPILFNLGVVGFRLPPIPEVILNVIIVIGGFLLLMDSFRII